MYAIINFFYGFVNERSVPNKLDYGWIRIKHNRNGSLTRESEKISFDVANYNITTNIDTINNCRQIAWLSELMMYGTEKDIKPPTSNFLECYIEVTELWIYLKPLIG